MSWSKCKRRGPAREWVWASPYKAATHHERFLSLMDVTPKALACSGFCSIQLSMSAPDKKPILRIHEGMECLNSASVAAMVARVASLGYCSNGGELQERFARTCCHSCRDFGRIFGQAFKSLPCVVVERVSGRGRARGQSKAERHDQERGNEPVRRRQAVGGQFSSMAAVAGCETLVSRP